MIIIDVQEIKRRGRYEASLRGGGLLVYNSAQPFLDAARKLLALGYGPDEKIAMRRPGSDADDLRSTIGKAARLRVTTSVFGRPIFAVVGQAEGPPVD